MSDRAASLPPAVRATGLGKRFSADWRGRRVEALADFSLTVPAGRIAALVGPNGSGKSTALRLLAGLLAPTSGSIELFGGTVAAAQAAGRIGYMPDRLTVPAHRRAGDWLGEWAALAGAEAEVPAVLAELGLAASAGQRVGALSLGQRQRLNLAQALLGRPGLLLLDEPAGGLDPRAVEALTRRLRAFREAGGAVVLSSHFLPQLETLADAVLLLDAGRVVREVTPEQVRAAGGLHRLFLEATAS